MLLAACIAAVSGIFAWMTSTKTISKIGFQINQISCKIKMYKGLESDYNGVPDLLGVGKGTNGTAAADITSYGGTYLKDSVWTYYTQNDIYYGERYAFELLENKSMLASDQSANTFTTVTLEDVEPSRVYVYKFSVASEGDSAAGYLNFSFDEYTASTTSTGEGSVTKTTTDASAFQCRMWRVVKNADTTDVTVEYTKYKTKKTNEQGNATTTTEWFDLDKSGTQLESNIYIAKYDKSKDSSTYMVDIWLQIRMNPEKENDFIGDTSEATDDTGATVTLPNFIIGFSTTKTS